MKTFPRIFQLFNVDGEQCMLFATELSPEDFDDVAVSAMIGDAFNQADYEEAPDFIERATELLSIDGVERIFAVPAYTNKI